MASLGVLALLALGAVPRSNAEAQYLFADTDGDERSTAADRLNSRGPTVVSIWIQTDANKDGSKAAYALAPTQGLTMFSYELILHAEGGEVKWGPYKNLIASMENNLGETSNARDFYTAHGGTTPLKQGKYLLGTLIVSVASGTPRLLFASGSS